MSQQSDAHFKARFEPQPTEEALGQTVYDQEIQ